MAPPNFAARWLVPRLARFTEAHPSPELHLASRSAMIDNGDATAARSSRRAPRTRRIAMVRFGDRPLSRRARGRGLLGRLRAGVQPQAPEGRASASRARGPAPPHAAARRHRGRGGRAAGLGGLAAIGGRDRHRRHARAALQRRGAGARRGHRRDGRHAGASSRCCAPRSRPGASPCPSTSRRPPASRTTSSLPRPPREEPRGRAPSARGCWRRRPPERA